LAIRSSLVAILLTAPPAPAQAPDADESYLAPGFELSVIASGLNQPVALQYAPDGRLFVAEKGGAIRIVVDGVVQPDPFATVDVYSFSEAGLLGLALDPDFPATPHVYVFASTSGVEQRIVRLTDTGGGVGGDPRVIRDSLPGCSSFHCGGCLRFGPDGMLYFSIGDTQSPDLAQDFSSLAGKICRIDKNGDTPADNPFVTPTGSPRAIWALGFRNPFRFSFLRDGRMLVGDVGSDGDARREELNVVSVRSNGGWPLVEGDFAASQVERYVRPLLAYHNEGTAVTGVVAYEAEQFPPAYRNDYFFLEYTLNRLYRVEMDDDGTYVRHRLMVQDGKGPVDLTVAPDGSLVYCEVFSGDIKRLAYAAANDPTDNANDNADDGSPPRAPLCGNGALLASVTCAGGLRLIRRRAPRGSTLI
jgi:glucose/arabinose dehydrogenase